MASDKITINYYTGGRFIEKEVDTGTTVDMLKTQEEVGSGASVSVNRTDKAGDYLLQSDDYVSFVTNNKTGGYTEAA
tara:strand:+ start:215 stop:445 length:231 start_codon:yes stop_codon:yes gene_type:complete